MLRFYSLVLSINLLISRRNVSIQGNLILNEVVDLKIDVFFFYLYTAIFTYSLQNDQFKTNFFFACELI